MGRHSVTVEKYVKQSKQKCRYSTLEGTINDKLLTLVQKTKKAFEFKVRHIWVKTLTVHPQQLPQVLLGTQMADKATSPACQKLELHFILALGLKALALRPLRGSENGTGAGPDLGWGQAKPPVLLLPFFLHTRKYICSSS